jgi:hypothetical protein
MPWSPFLASKGNMAGLADLDIEAYSINLSRKSEYTPCRDQPGLQIRHAPPVFVERVCRAAATSWHHHRAPAAHLNTATYPYSSVLPTFLSSPGLRKRLPLPPSSLPVLKRPTWRSYHCHCPLQTLFGRRITEEASRCCIRSSNKCVSSARVPSVRLNSHHPRVSLKMTRSSLSYG